jgi:peptide chain release factor 1
MDDYRKVQLAELQQKITDTKLLLEDPSMAELVSAELAELEEQKKQLEESLAASYTEEPESYDHRNAMLQVSGAAGGEEAKLWADELLRMYSAALPNCMALK